MSRRGLAAALVLGSVAACESAPPRAPVDHSGTVTVELTAFEVRADGIDRFEHCPPPGEIGQDWVPAIPEWHPPAASASAAVPESAVEAAGGGPDASSSGDTVAPPAPASHAELVDEASSQSRAAFRRCFHRGLLYDPTEDGHVAVVLRVDRTGHVVRAETWGACDLSHEALACMREEAVQLRLHPPAEGAATLTVPAVFTKGAPRPEAPHGGWAAAAYVAVETMRPRLHRCEETARLAHADPFASAVYTIDVDGKGRGVHVAVDQWKGGHELLACAAEALRDAPFPAPPGVRGKVVVPVIFNPRPFTR
jgi:hypothetical protein